MFVRHAYSLSLQRHLLDILDKVAIDDIPIILTVANLCSNTCTKLLTGCIEIVTSSDLDAVTLEKPLPPGIVKLIMESRQKLGLVGPGGSDFPDKHVRRIYRALDSDDVELVRMLLREGNTSLNDSYALHYAVAHCDSKITTELLDLGLADVNHRNARGYTVLHIAAMRKEPKIIVSLLTKGARPADLTSDGIKALQIAKRLTKHVDYRNSTEEGKASPKDRLCIEILEQAERRDPLIGEASVSLAIAGDDLRGKLLYLENRGDILTGLSLVSFLLVTLCSSPFFVAVYLTSLRNLYSCKLNMIQIDICFHSCFSEKTFIYQLVQSLTMPC